MASKKIQGITIRLGADSTELSKALKDANNTSKGLNKELGEVNRLLKFDPKSTTMLAQKQKILAEAVENTEKKLDALKQAQGEVEKMFDAGEIGTKEYREFQRIIEETEQSLRTYQIQQSKLTEEQGKLEQSTKQLNTLLEATGKTLDDFQDILGSKLTNAIKDGKANSDDLTIAINKIGKAALGADTDIGKMKDALNQIDNGDIGAVRQELAKLEDNANATDDALGDIGKGVAQGNLLEAADQISGIGDKVIELGKEAVNTSQEMENAAAKTSAYFGETGKEAQENADLIKEIYESGIGESLDKVADSAITVKQNLKELDDTSLKNTTEQAITLEELYGIDMNESMRGVNALMENFGLDATSAMDLLVAGTQNGLDKTKELGDNLSEYSGKFEQAGYSASDYFQLLQNGLDSGAYNLDKVNDAINEVTNRLADGTIAENLGMYSQKTQELFREWQNGKATQKDVIDSIVSDISSCENQQDALNRATTAFGTLAEDGGLKVVSSLTTIGDSYKDVSGKAAEMQKNTTTSSQEMEAAARKIEDAFQPIGEDIQEALLPIFEFLANLMQAFAELPGPVRTFIEVFGGIMALVAVITPVITAIMAMNTALVTLVGVGLAPIIGIAAAVAAAIAGIVLVVKNWGTITDWLSEKWAAFTEWIGGIWDGISETIQMVWTGIKDFFSEIWQQIYTVIEVPLNLIKSIIEGVMYAIYAVIYTIWEVIKAALGAAWNWIKDTASAIFTPIIGFFSGVWTGIKDTAIDIWNTIKDTLGSIWNAIKEKVTSVFSTMWNYIKDGFTSLKNTLGGIVRGIANAIISPIGKAINGVIKGVNWILDKVGSKKQFDLWDVPKFAKGAGGIRKDTIGIVNDQKGPVYEELIVPPKGKPFIAKGRDVMLPLEKGTKIMPAKQTKEMMKSIPHFAGGIGEFASGVWETVKDFTGNVFDYITHPKKIVQIAIDKFTSFAGIVEPWLTVAKGAVGSVIDGIVDFIKGIFDTETKINYSPTAGVEQWRGLAEKALRMTGQYTPANLERMLFQMQTESGGNPNAINNWDINAKNGTPSKGLMQVIDPTFRSYAMQGFNTNIWDPLSNMLAAIRYSIARYGSLTRAWQGHGYANGIGDIGLSDLFSMPLLDVSWFKEGGILTKPAAFATGAGSIGIAGESKPEAIAPVTKLKSYIQDAVQVAVAEMFADKEINITLNIDNNLDGKTITRQTVRYMKPMLEKENKLQEMIQKGKR
ncbi:phage tail tape measure protein [Claveliimonas bilis]|uniref:phage tail tape measure protein n=1 Tax=Claveliimonas bilis TaxID=3028070 RepID=UPI0029314468|nr:phage tail tape measure protein [Claveliimonas bilis]BDZ81420.1 hypothetical protein Lac3_26290 [Claveliimonas bilis]